MGVANEWFRLSFPAIAGFTLLALGFGHPAFSQACDPPSATAVSIQGSVEVRRASSSAWVPLALGDHLCGEDSVRAGSRSRAALSLQDQTVVRLNENSTVTFPTPRDNKRTWLQVLTGVMHVITRDPRSLRVLTPFANAGIEGTEFQVTVTAANARVLVLEGAVAIESPAGNTALAHSGQEVTADGSGRLVVQAVVRPRDAVQWTLFYPAVSQADPAGAGAGRATQLLVVGRVDDARIELDRALRNNPADADAMAIRAIVALTQDDTATAAGHAAAAVAVRPDSAAALMALSYVRQAAFDLPGAVQAQQQAVAVEPGNALAQARLAELWLATGEHDQAVAVARQAVAADPGVALAHTVLGFASLAAQQIDTARDSFLEAIRLDSAAPLPRLGLGLALVRDGKLAEGREQIEIAVLLDPGSSLLRSYVGKAYYEEKRDKLAASQLELAKELDPNDPTPWFYDAIRKQTVNRPVEALVDLDHSTTLNDRRGIYRSRLLLDDDAAARNASVSAIYSELGFEELAVREGTAALGENFGNSSAHRLLANAYANLPRYEISRVSEALQAEIRQPLSATPLRLSESQNNLGIYRYAGPSRIGSSEYNSLFSRDQLLFQLDGTSGSRSTSSDEAALSGLAGRVGFSLGQLHHETDGFGDNNRGEKDVYAAFLQYQPTDATTLQVDGRRSTFLLDYVFFPKDEFLITPLEIDEETEVLRINGRHADSPAGDWIFSAAYEDRKRDVNYPPLALLVTQTEVDSYAAEIQRLVTVGNLQLIGGAGYITKDENFPIELAQVDSYDVNGYLYAQQRFPEQRLTLTGGLAYDHFRQDYSALPNFIERRQLSPKLGVSWSPLDGTTLRGAAFTSVRRSFIESQTIEPTTVAGFNQFFTGIEQFYGDPEGTISRRVALGIDQQLAALTFAGIEAATRQLEVPSVIEDKDYGWREKSARAYLYHGLDPQGWGGWNLALTASGEVDRQRRARSLPGSEGFIELDTTRVPFGLAVFSPRGITFRAVTTYVRQSGDFSADTLLPIVASSDDAWLTDLALEYRLPKRLGMLSLACRNIFDHDLDLVDTDPLNPRDARRRLVITRFSIQF